MLRTGPYRTTRTRCVRAAGQHGPVPAKLGACGRLGCLSRGKPQRQGEVRSTSPNSGQGGLEPCPQGNPAGIEPDEASGAKPCKGVGIRFFNRRGKNASMLFQTCMLKQHNLLQLSKSFYV